MQEKRHIFYRSETYTRITRITVQSILALLVISVAPCLPSPHPHYSLHLLRVSKSDISIRLGNPDALTPDLNLGLPRSRSAKTDAFLKAKERAEAQAKKSKLPREVREKEAQKEREVFISLMVTKIRWN